MRLLLDTCAFVWMIGAPRDLSRVALAAVTAPDNELYLSAISTWEIVYKCARGRLALPREAARYIPEKRVAHRIAALPFDEAAALASSRLPLLHRDPFDRMLVCQAIAAGLTIVTPDELIRQYPAPTLW